MRGRALVCCVPPLGSALLAGRQYAEAVEAFALATRLDPTSSPKEANLGQAYAALGDRTAAEQHLERAMELDPVNLSAAQRSYSTTVPHCRSAGGVSEGM